MHRVRPDVTLAGDVVLLEFRLICRICIDQLCIESAMVDEDRGFDFGYLCQWRRTAIKGSGGRQIGAQKSGESIGHASTEAETGDANLAVTEWMRFQPSRSGDEILRHLRSIDLTE